MPALLRDRLFGVWALLVAVTLVSIGMGGAVASAGAVTAAVLAMAFAKSWLVMFEFMELRGAPIALRLLATFWLVLALGALLAIYFGWFRI